jgi:hypothetical protein
LDFFVTEDEHAAGISTLGASVNDQDKFGGFIDPVRSIWVILIWEGDE